MTGMTRDGQRGPGISGMTSNGKDDWDDTG